MAAKKPPFHEQVATQLIKQLEAGTAPWQKEWEPGSQINELPYNPTTGNRYRGINSLYLQSSGHEDPRWMTYKQAQSIDAQVNRGEKGTTIQFWKFNDEKAVRGEDGKPVKTRGGKTVKDQTKLDRPRVFFASVFNAEQISGLPPLERPERQSHDWQRIERAEHILKASGAEIRHEDQSHAYYSPGKDVITLPLQTQFKSADAYYATAIHEVGHWTGHETRLARDLANPFGSEGYAREELRAEIGSIIVGSELQLGHDPKHHASYVGFWIKALKEDPLEIFRAAADAEKISDYVMAFERSREKQAEAETHAEQTPAETSRPVSEKAATLQALATKFVNAQTEDPELRTRLQAAMDSELSRREQAGKLPLIPVRDRTPVKERQPKRESEHDLSR